MQHLSNYIHIIWWSIGLMLCVLSLSNSVMTRISSVFLFLFFSIIAGARGSSFNSDTANYSAHFLDAAASSDIYSSTIYSWFEPGYNLLIYLIGRTTHNASFALMVICVITALLFSTCFLKFKYHPILITFIFASTSLVGSTAIVRQYLAMAFAFIALNIVIVTDKKLGGIRGILPVVFHYSSIPISALLMSFRRGKLVFLAAAVMFFCLLIIPIHEIPGYERIFQHAMGRAVDTSGSKGFRNLQNICMCLLIICNFRGMKIDLRRIDYWLLVVTLISLLLIFIPGLNRITSFFSLLVVCLFQREILNSRIPPINLLFVNATNLLVINYFYFFHTLK